MEVQDAGTTRGAAMLQPFLEESKEGFNLLIFKQAIHDKTTTLLDGTPCVSKNITKVY